MAIILVADFYISPPDEWTHQSTMFTRTILIYFALGLIPIYILYLLIICLKPHKIEVYFDGKKILYGKKIIDFSQVKKVSIKKRMMSFSISFENIYCIFRIPNWYREESVPHVALKIKTYCKKNNLEFQVFERV
ncbi:MAG: hypothetical protein HRT38_20370 [Alteromonadaceae bacterium]|nr:hypothetical protein [Alteromonadaceae bacterium]